jgi:hypothetical protein
MFKTLPDEFIPSSNSATKAVFDLMAPPLTDEIDADPL